MLDYLQYKTEDNAISALKKVISVGVRDLCHILMGHFQHVLYIHCAFHSNLHTYCSTTSTGSFRLLCVTLFKSCVTQLKITWSNVTWRSWRWSNITWGPYMYVVMCFSAGVRRHYIVTGVQVGTVFCAAVLICSIQKLFQMFVSYSSSIRLRLISIYWQQR